MPNLSFRPQNKPINVKREPKLAVLSSSYGLTINGQPKLCWVSGLMLVALLHFEMFLLTSCSWDAYNNKPVIPSIKLKVLHLQENFYFIAHRFKIFKSKEHPYYNTYRIRFCYDAFNSNFIFFTCLELLFLHAKTQNVDIISIIYVKSKINSVHQYWRKMMSVTQVNA